MQATVKIYLRIVNCDSGQRKGIELMSVLLRSFRRHFAERPGRLHFFQKDKNEEAQEPLPKIQSDPRQKASGVLKILQTACFVLKDKSLSRYVHLIVQY